MLSDSIWKRRLALISPEGKPPLALELTEASLDDLKQFPNWWLFMKLEGNTGRVTHIYDMPLTLGTENRIQGPTGAWETI